MEPTRTTVSRNLGTTLTLAFVAMSVAALLVSGVVGILFLIQTQKEAVAGKQHVVARQAADAVAGFIQDKFIVMEAAVRLTGSDRERENALQALLGMEPAFRQLLLLNTENEALFRASRMSQIESGRLDQQLGADPFRRVSDGQRHIGTVYVDQVTSEPLVILSVPVTTLLGDRLGALLAEVNLKFIWELVDRLRVGETGHAYVVDRKGRLIAFGETGRVLRGETLDHLSDVAAFIDQPEKKENIDVHTFVGITGKKVVGTYVPLGDPDWAVMTELPVMEAYRPVIRNGLISIIVLLCISALAGWLGIFLARRLATPIVDLTRTATCITDGKLDVKAQMSGPAEVIQLSAAFNQMTRQLGLMLNGEAERSQVLELEIAERKRMAQALKAGEARLNNLTANVPGVVIQFRTTRDYIYTNEFLNAKITDIFGIEQDSETVLDQFYACIPDTEKEAYAASMREAIDTVGPWNYEGRFNKPSGETIWFSGRALPQVEGDTIVYYGVLLDITERKKAEESLRLTQFIFDKAPIGIWRMGAAGEVLDVNEQGCASLGYSKEDLCRMTVLDFDPHFDTEDVWTRNREALEKLGTTTIESQHRRKSGEIFPIEVIQDLVRFEDQELHVAFVQDITERKRMEDALRESEQRLEMALSSANEGIWDWRIDEDILYLDSRYYTMAGYRPNEFPCDFNEILKRVHPDDLAGVKSFKDQYLAGKRDAFEVEFRFLRKDGEYMWIQAKGKIVDWDEKGASTRFVGTNTDITRQKQDEEELRRLRNYLANIIDSMPSILLAVDRQGRVTQWNRQAEKATGLDFEDARARPLAKVFPRLADKMERIQTSIAECRVISSPKVPRKMEHEIRYEDITIFPLVGSGLEGAVIRVDDITQQVRLEEMMIQSEKMLSIGGLAAGMAHEINNPLAGIVQSASVIENRLLGDLPANHKAAETAGTTLAAIKAYLALRKLPDLIGNIRESGSRAAAIVRNMLSFARKSEKVISSNDLGALLDQTLELLKTDYDMRKHFDFKQIRIQREYDPAAAPVPCEAGKLQQVFMNILKNGAEAMAEATDATAPPAFILRVQDDDTWVRVEIEDNGPGMDEQTRRRIFEPFFTTKALGKGTGLGLSVSYFIITEDHGGQMSAHAAEGGGTCFVVRLPKGGAGNR